MRYLQLSVIYYYVLIVRYSRYLQNIVLEIFWPTRNFPVAFPYTEPDSVYRERITPFLIPPLPFQFCVSSAQMEHRPRVKAQKLRYRTMTTIPRAFGLSGTLIVANPRISFSVDQERRCTTRLISIRSIGNTANETPSFLRFVNSDHLESPGRIAQHPYSAYREHWLETGTKGFRSIRNTACSDRWPAIRPIENGFGTSGTEYWSIRYESSAYQERFLGLSGTGPAGER